MIYPQPTKIFTAFPDKEPLLTSDLFMKLESCEKKIIVLQGGGDAAKTATALTWLTIKAIQTPKTKISVVGPTIPHLKDGALQLFQNYIEDNPQVAPYIRSYNKTDRDYDINGSRMVYKAYETSRKARGSENDYVFMNEGNLMDYDLFWELQRKCRKAVIIDYNPTFAFWVHAKLLKPDGKDFEKQFLGQVQLFIVDHRHNPFLSQQDHDNYENISDPERHRVYARGLTGQTKGAIFNFKKVDGLPELPKGVEWKIGWGMDVGYTTDKTTIVKVYMNGKDHYYHELLYKSNDEIQNEINAGGLMGADGNPQTVDGYIAAILIANGCDTASLLWGDHDKNISTKLRNRHRIPYRMAKKGPNSVPASISSVKRFNGYYFDSPNLETELLTYVWLTVIDVLTGNEVTTGEPVDGVPDHCFIGSTMIETNKGHVAIKNIVQGDFVKTTEGFKKVLFKWNNGLQQVNKYILQLDTFIVSLTCTPNHLIKTDSGWIQISQLQSEMTINLSNFLMEKVLNSNQESIILTTDHSGCTSTFGGSIMDQYQKVSMYTTKMITPGITELKTLNANQVSSIYQITERKDLSLIKNGLKNLEKRPSKAIKNGLKHPKAKKRLLQKGITINSGKEISAKQIARNAGNTLSEKVIIQNFAHQTVSKQQEDKQVSIMNKGHAQCAEQNLPQIDIQKQKYVVQNVQVLPAGIQNVYDLTVEDCHEYYANGVLVHNCIAAIRYFSHSYAMRFAG